ncbi:hypothetical protein NLG97_g6533 [Lecanicillium saksenae]|uniref:Uncharacterized protein n=1 Tax=Lecanicillium saksenae TaxID=468837 RepID=A0ACC1QT62_9HYPO|nr:hypothetical protein NLG97_g6533 [Lecanicillium saksenae]
MWRANPQMKDSGGKGRGFVYQGAENDRLFSPDYHHGGGRTCDDCDSSREIKRDQRETTDPKIHYGIIASGNTLVKDAVARDMIVQSVGDACICVEMEAAGLMDRFPCLVIRGISDYADSHKNDRWQRYASATAAAYAKELLSHVPVKLLQSTARAAQVLESKESCAAYGEPPRPEMPPSLQLTQHLSNRTEVLNNKQRALMQRLPVAEGAAFDSRAEQHNATCLPQTRVELLRQIQDWADDPGAQPLFWLQGMAGTGKSTISRTLAGFFASQMRLGASFFFKRSEADRGTCSKFFTTLAADLVRRQPLTAQYIQDALDQDSRIEAANMGEQFEKLFLTPLEKMADKENHCPILVIIDALDECQGDDDVNHIIRLFSGVKARSQRTVKLFLTSRPELPLRLGFAAVRGTYEELVLHDISGDLIERDISIFMAHKLAEIRDNFDASVSSSRQIGSEWPTKANLQALVDMAIPLFIFAATVCRFIEDRKLGNPGKQLIKVLQNGSKGYRSHLGQIYLLVLGQQVLDVSPEDEQDILTEFREIVGPIVILARPLSIETLAKLLDIPEDAVADRLDLLHSVLHVPMAAAGPVTLLHQSFRDFLLDPAGKDTNPFWVNEKECHENILHCCLRVMAKLRQNVCGIRDPAMTRSKIHPMMLSSHLPLEVQYAVQFWVLHLESASFSVCDASDVHTFLQRHFLHWVEALALLGRAFEITSLIMKLQSRLKDGESTAVTLFLEDATRFLHNYVSVIDLTPLQLYSSLLLFAPKASIIRRTFEREMHRFRTKPRPEEDWSPRLQTFEGQGGMLVSVSYSRDSTRVLTAATDGTLCIWDSTTGKCLQTFRLKNINGAVLSHDGTLVAVRWFAARPGSVSIGCIESGEFLPTFDDYVDNCSAFSFSHDSSSLVLASKNGSLQVHDANTGSRLETLTGHAGAVTSLAFSHDSSILVSGSHDQTARIWDMHTGKCEQTLQGHTSHVKAVALSLDTALVATGSDDATCRLWLLDTGITIRVFDGYKFGIQAVAFSPDSRLFALAAESSVHIWRTDAWSERKVLQGRHGHTVQCIDFSSDSKRLLLGDSNVASVWAVQQLASQQTGRDDRHKAAVVALALSNTLHLVASSSFDNTVRIWSTKTGLCLRTLEFSDHVGSLAFSHNSVLLATGDSQVSIWNTNTGRRKHQLEGHTSSVVQVEFSPDSILLASSTWKWDSTLRVWDLKTGICLWKTPQTNVDLFGLWNTPQTDVDPFRFFSRPLLLAHVSYNAIRIRRAESGDSMLNLEGHSSRILAIALSADYTVLASSSTDKHVRLWCSSTGACRRALVLDCAPARSLRFSPDGERLFTDLGVIDTRDGVFKPAARLPDNDMPVEDSLYGVADDCCWVTRNGKNLLWIPPQFRPIHSRMCAVSRSTVAIGSSFGHVAVIRF